MTSSPSLSRRSYHRQRSQQETLGGLSLPQNPSGVTKSSICSIAVVMSLACVASDHGIWSGFSLPFRGVNHHSLQIVRLFSNSVSHFYPQKPKNQSKQIMWDCVKLNMRSNSPDFSPDSKNVNTEDFTGDGQGFNISGSVDARARISTALASIFEPMLLPVAVIALQLLTHSSNQRQEPRR